MNEQPVTSCCPNGLWNDLVNVIKRDKATMLKVAKNESYFKIALGLYALTQAATVLNQWLSMRSSYKLMKTLGITSSGVDWLSLVKQGVFGFIMGIFLMALMYFISIKLFKGKEEIEVKGFMTLYCFIVSPMLLVFIPVVGFLALLWVLVLFFTMMNYVFGFSGWKTVLVVFVALILWAIAAGPLGAVIGVNSGFSTDFSFEL